jgi:hypothetical protein
VGVPGGGPILGAWPELPWPAAWPPPWSAVAAAIRAGVQNAAAARWAARLTACTAPGVALEVGPGAGIPAWRDGGVADVDAIADGAEGSSIAVASAMAAPRNGVGNFRILSALRHQMTACPECRRTDTFHC